MHVYACEHMQKHTQTHVKMLINYVKSRSNSRKCIKYKNTQTYLKSTQTHVKAQTNASCWDVIHTDRILYDMNSDINLGYTNFS